MMLCNMMSSVVYTQYTILICNEKLKKKIKFNLVTEDLILYKKNRDLVEDGLLYT